MDETRPDRRKMRSPTLAALLGLFVLAALVAIVGRLLPGGLSRFVARLLRRGDHEDPDRS